MKDVNNRSGHTGPDTPPSQWGSELAKIEVPLPDHSDAEPAREAAPQAAATWLPLLGWMREGLRAAFFLRPRTRAATPTPWQLLCLSVIASALLVGAARFEVVGPADFNVRGWLATMWTSLVLLWVVWWATTPAAQHRTVEPASTRPSLGRATLSGGVAAWYVLSMWAPLLPVLLLYALSATQVHQPALWDGPVAAVGFWVGYTGLTLWMLAALVVVSARFIESRWRAVVFAVALVCVVGVGAWLFPDQPWEARALPVADASAPLPGAQEDNSEPSRDEEPAQLVLSQGVFEGQQVLWHQQVDALLPERPGVTDVYGLVFAPYAEEDVFLRESTMVSTLLQERFDARGRVLHLLNHADTAATHAWATPENLQRAVAALGARMDREHDVLVVYLTSHGARDHALAAANGPLQVAPATPEMLRAALDNAGIRNRVIAVSACYSGGWIASLETDHTLMMTAADATHTSYGCGSLSPLTFFGRAVFDEQLRTTHSFAEAFAKAVPVIAQREVEAGKADGFSNPQIRVGSLIAPVLKELEQRLDASETAPGNSKAQLAAPGATIATGAAPATAARNATAVTAVGRD